MQYAKMLGLFAAAATSLMAFSATASADTLTAPAGTDFSGTIKATSETLITFHTIVDVTCNHSELEAKVEVHGTGRTVEAKVNKLTFTGCNHHITVLKPGRLIFHATSNGHATVTLVDAEITKTVTTIFGATHCLSGTAGGVGTPIGTLTPAPSSDKHATLDLDGNIPTLSTDFACGFSPGAWTGQYKITSPTGLTSHVS